MGSIRKWRVQSQCAAARRPIGIFGTVGFAAEVQTEFNEVKDHASCTDVVF